MRRLRYCVAHPLAGRYVFNFMELILIEKLIKEIRDVKLEVNSLLSKKKKYTCCHPECNEKSILSHSISKSTLKLISREHHVKFPKFNRAKFGLRELENKSINLCLDDISIELAGTFKGFCSLHDNDIFENIDNRGIKTQRDIFLQIYRTAQKFLFTDLVNSKAELKILGYEYHSNSEFEESIYINLEKIICLCEDLLVDFPELDSPIDIRNTETLFLKPFSEKVSLEVEVIYKRINTVFPVALQNCLTLNFEGKFSKSIVVILPDVESTNIIILCPINITPQYSSCLNSEIKILNFIESILMLDSDFYLDKTVVDNWSEDKLSKITNDYYFFDERSFLEEYDISIFDDLRKKICLSLPEKERVIELEKIYSLPNRDSLEKRHNSQMLGSIKDRQKKLLHTGNVSKVCYPIGSLRVL